MHINHRQQRCIFNVDDFVHYRENNINQLFQIFIHEVLIDQRRLFALIQKIVF